MILRYHQDLDYRAIGQAQGCSALTARVRTWRGLRRLRQGVLLLGLVLVRGESLAAGEVLGGQSGQPSVPGSLPTMTADAGWTWRVSRWLGPAIAASLVIFVGTWICSGPQATPTIPKTSGSPWWHRPDLGTWIYHPDRQAVSADASPEDSNQVVIRFDARIILWRTTCPWPRGRVQVFSREGSLPLLEQLAREGSGCEVVEHPNLTLFPGQLGSSSLINQTAFLTGYELKGAVADPHIEVLNFGRTLNVRGWPIGDRVCIDRAQCTETDLVGSSTHFAQQAGPGSKKLIWDEPTLRESHSLDLPAPGVTLRPGEMLLIPPSWTRNLHLSPEALDTGPKSDAEGTWVLLSAEQEGPAAPAAPVPVGRS